LAGGYCSHKLALIVADDSDNSDNIDDNDDIEDKDDDDDAKKRVWRIEL
jgi:hypothetical protein